MSEHINRVIYSDDCLNVLRDPLAIPTGSVDLIYLDPPFNSKNHYNLPFKGQYAKDARPVEAFTDLWSWGAAEDEMLDDLDAGPMTRTLANIVRLAHDVEQGRGLAPTYRLDAYLINMAVRLIEMRSVLSPSGSIYLHCDPTASHYLKLVMDAIFGKQNFRNEIVWCYRGGGTPKQDFGRRHDVILRYTKSPNYRFMPDSVRIPYQAEGIERTDDAMWGKHQGTNKVYKPHPLGKVPEDWWPMNILNANDPERLGYPTQKPVALLERIIRASSNEGDIVLDPYCGCGTAVHVAEQWGRRWIGIDISAFATGLIRRRILDNFKELTTHDVLVRGLPLTIGEARALARRDGFEFEKWVCGAIGAGGMFKEPGERGADGGVDGILHFVPIHWGEKPKPEYAIVQVKGGDVSADAVKALETTVRRSGASAGVMVCFRDQMQTVENQRGADTFRDDMGTYPFIQGYSVEDLQANKPLDLPARLRPGMRVPGSSTGTRPLV